jgi:lipoprotein LpqH
MDKGWLIACAVGIAMAPVLVACSDRAQAPEPRGALSPGTAEISIQGAPEQTTHAVNCMSLGKSLTSIVTGNDTSGATAAIDTSKEPTVQYANFRDVAGFTGSYRAQLGSSAEVSMTGATYRISGTAMGFTKDNPSARVSNTFSMTVAC